MTNLYQASSCSCKTKSRYQLPVVTMTVSQKSDFEKDVVQLEEKAGGRL
jgi:hypothetical protein